MKIFFNIILILCPFTIVYSQSSILNIKSPETAAFERSGNIPINKFTGGLDFNIPLFDLNVGDISTQINLSYDSSGFLPAKKSGYAGLNWNINYSGMISREIRGIADDFEGNESSALQGFLAAVKVGKTNHDIFNNNYLASSLPHTVQDTYGIYLGNHGKYAELSSDKYNFNFWGISGYFYIGNDGKPLVTSNDQNLTIDLSGYTQQNVAEQTDCNPLSSVFVITDGRGNKYHFGGSFDNLEVSSSLGKEATANNPGGLQTPNLTILSWYLFKIELISGQQVVYTYNEDRLGYSIESNYCKQYNTLPYVSDMNQVAFSFDIHKYINQTVSSEKHKYEGSVGGSHVTGSGISSTWTSPFWMFNILKKTKLNKIAILTKNISDNQLTSIYTIDFNYQNTPDNLAYRYDFLESIDVKSQNQIVKKIKFKILPKGTESKRWFLTELAINDQKYTFNYNNVTYFPPEATFGVDFLGFWNGKDDNKSIIPAYSFNLNTGDLTLTGTNRDFNPTYAEVGMIKEIIYPTGGRTEMFFEPHKINYKIIRNSQSNFYPQLTASNDNVSGLRLYKMIDKSGSGNDIIREYKYLKNRDNPSLGSSGISLTNYIFFKYAKYRTTLPNSITDKETFTEFGSNIEQSIFSKPNVEYNKVQEYVNGSLFKEYVFSNYFSYPNYLDSDPMANNIILWRPYNSNFGIGNYMKNIDTQFIDESGKRGKLLEENFFADNIEVKKISTEYVTLNNKPYCKNFNENNSLVYKCGNTSNDYVTDASIIGGNWVQKRRIDVKPFVKFSTIIEDYLPNGNIFTNTLYRYDDNTTLNMSGAESSYFPEEVSKISYKYSTTYNDLKLINNNILAPVLETIRSKDIWKSTSFLNYVTSRTKTEYTNPTNFFPSAFISYSIDSNIPAESIIYDFYDNNGNLLQYTTKSGTPTAIIWGYNQTQPIAKIEGATYSQVSALAAAIITASDYGSPHYSESTLIDKLDTFRISLPHYQISTYTYKPLIGVTSITPPSGIREIYKYDSANRLQSITDINGNIIKEYNYNYATTKYYNVEKSQTFTRSNCGSNAIGGIYTYYVPEGKYSSMVSQADADQKAQNDINSNGQMAANINGTCTLVSGCSLTYYFNGGGSVSFENGNYKITIGFSTGPNSINLPWSTGVRIATIQGICRPSVEYNGYNGQVYYKVMTNGDIIVRSHNGVYPNNTTYNYLLYYPFN